MVDESSVLVGADLPDMDDLGNHEVNPHRNVILEDVKNRQEWATIDEEILKRRRGRRKKRKTQPYPNAPNGLVPIVDDTTGEKTDQEITMTCNAPTFAHIIPLTDQMDNRRRMIAELSFDTYLRHIIQIRPKLEEAMDTKNARGFGLFMVTRTEHEVFGEIPDCDAVDPRDLIVPYNTKELSKAERFARVLRLSPDELRRLAEQKGWENVEQVIQVAQSDDRESSTSEEDDALTVVANLVGLTTSGKHTKTVVVWEFYHHATAWDLQQDNGGTGEIEKGKRCVSIFSPDAPQYLLAHYAWKEMDKTRPRGPDEMAAEIVAAQQAGRQPELTVSERGADRPWPVIQARSENRSRYYYDTRGIGHRCMDEQIFATAILNGKQVMMDYFQQPLLKGSGARTSTNVTFEPGSFLPEGAEFAVPPPIPAQFDFDIEMFKRTAARRAGVGGQYEFSGEMSRTRKVQKTAREVEEESARSGMVSSASVDRFNDPLRDLYQQLWADLRRMEKRLPMIVNNRFQGMAGPEIYRFPVLIIPAASAKSLNPEAQFVKGRSAFEFLMQFKDYVPINVSEALVDILANWDPVRAGRWVQQDDRPGNEQPPIYRVLQGLQEQIGKVAQAAKLMNKTVEGHERVLERVARLSQGNAEALQRMSEKERNNNEMVETQGRNPYIRLQ